MYTYWILDLRVFSGFGAWARRNLIPLLNYGNDVSQNAAQLPSFVYQYLTSQLEYSFLIKLVLFAAGSDDVSSGQIWKIDEIWSKIISKTAVSGQPIFYVLFVHCIPILLRIIILYSTKLCRYHKCPFKIYFIVSAVEKWLEYLNEWK